MTSERVDAVFKVDWRAAAEAMHQMGEAVGRTGRILATAQEAKVLGVPYESGTRAFKAAFDAAFPGLPGGMTQAEAERRLTAALIAYDGVKETEQAEREASER